MVIVNRKPTNTDKYLNFDLHHHVQHKCAVGQTLLDLATSLLVRVRVVVRDNGISASLPSVK